MNNKWIFPMLIVALACAGCTKTATGPLPTLTIPAPELGTPTMITATPQPTAPLQPPTLAVASPTAGPFSPFQAESMVDLLKLRVGPGFLFDALMLLNLGDQLTVQGKAPGAEWLKVEAADGSQGWVFAQLLKIDRDLRNVPIIQPQDVGVLNGKITDMTGLPISGIQFAITQGEARNAAVTDENGEFFAFFPIDVDEAWLVSFDGVVCTSNTWVDTSCTSYKNGYTGAVDPASLSVTLPSEEQLTFMWR